MGDLGNAGYPNPVLPAAQPIGPAIPTPVTNPASSPPQAPGQGTAYVTQQETRPAGLGAYIKLVYILVFVGVLGAGGYFIGKRMLGSKSTGVEGEILYQVRYQPVLWKDFGEVFEPIVKIPLYYPSDGFKKMEFLLDSGALVSSLPREEAKKMGLSLAKLPRSTFGGFGGTTSFAYRGEAKIKLGEMEVLLPCVFTEAEGTKAILGRSGFFENYNIYFNAEREMIEVRE